MEALCGLLGKAIIAVAVVVLAILFLPPILIILL